MNNQYKITAEFTRELSDDAPLAGGTSTKKLIAQFVKELQSAYNEGIIGGSFRVLKVTKS